MSLIKPATELHRRTGQIVRYAFARGRPPLHATVLVAEAFRAAALSAFHALTGSKESFLLSGHTPDGAADEKHRHAYFLPQPDHTQTLSGILIVSPHDRFSAHETAALQMVKAIRWNGPSTKLAVELIDADDRSAVELASHWVSLTPYVPLRRFWGTHGKHHLTPEKQLASEVKGTDLPGTLDTASVTRWDEICVRVAPRVQRNGLNTRPSRRVAFLAEFRSQIPVCAPVALGHSCHFGLGQFVAKKA